MPAMRHLNDWLADSGCGCKIGDTLLRVDQLAGGSKHLNCFLYAAGINYLPVTDFIEEFMEAPWQHPEMNRLLIRTEDADWPTCYQPGKGKLE